MASFFVHRISYIFVYLPYFSSSSLLAQPGVEREVQQGGQPSGLRERRQISQYLLNTCLKYTLSTVQMSSGVLISLIGSLIWTSYRGCIKSHWEGVSGNDFWAFGNGKGMANFIPKVREREGNGKKHFPKFRIRKGIKNHSPNPGMGRE